MFVFASLAWEESSNFWGPWKADCGAEVDSVVVIDQVAGCCKWSYLSFHWGISRFLYFLLIFLIFFTPLPVYLVYFC